MNWLFISDREICRTCRTCPADFCWCPAESSDLAGHFVQQGSIHIKCPTRKIRMTTEFTSHQLGKMSDRGSKCPAEHWRPAGHFVRHAKNNFRDHWLFMIIFCSPKLLFSPIFIQILSDFQVKRSRYHSVRICLDIFLLGRGYSFYILSVIVFLYQFQKWYKRQKEKEDKAWRISGEFIYNEIQSCPHCYQV